MSLGKNIKRIRENKKITQEELANMLNVSFQAISAWERDEYKPELSNLLNLAEKLNVPLSKIVENNTFEFENKDTIFNLEHMKTYVKTTALNLKLENTLKALSFAEKAHNGQLRKNSKVPYIYHPLTLACHCLSMNIKEDDVIAACLLHDVVEDCNVNIKEIPVDDGIKLLIELLTHPKTNDNNREKIMDSYYNKINNNPKASLIKCVDRCNNLTTMSWGLSKDRIYRMIKETEKYYPSLLKTIKENINYNNAYWLLKYQIESMLDIYKRLI